MILVVTQELTLSFLLQHQGRFLHSARTAGDAIAALRMYEKNLEGVILDDRIRNSRMVKGYIKNKMPQMLIVPWQVAQRNSPFKIVALHAKPAAKTEDQPLPEEQDRYIWYAKTRTGELRQTAETSR